ncbi:MAG: hypothetical protein IPH90_11270 [Thermomonas sp.]|nr:hypothetical protein [Thermomonas sp.]
MKSELVIDDGLRIRVGDEMLGAALRCWVVGDDNVAQLGALANHPAKEVRVALASKENLSQAAFRKLFATRDFAVIEALLSNSGNAEYFSKDMLAGLISQSEFAHIVARGLGDFPNADDSIGEALAAHPDPYVRHAMAGYYDAPKKLPAHAGE